MAKFQYSALKNNSQIISGEIDAANYREAREKIRQLGFVPTKVYTEEAALSAPEQVEINKNQVSGKKIKHLSLQEKIIFTSELQVLLSAGIPIMDALHSVEVNTPKEKIRVICQNLQHCIMNGMTFATALSSLYNETFGSVYIGLVKTGEDAGELDETLARMLVLLRKQEDIKGKIINASIYPAILIVIMTGVLMLFSMKVFPAFYGVLQMGAADIPIYSQMLIGFCEFINQFWWLVLCGIGAFFGGISILFKNPQFKAKWDNFVLKIPVISDFIQYINLSNFMTVLHISYDAGLPIMSGLELSNKTVGNFVIKKKVYNAVNMVRNGRSLSEAFEMSGAIPPALMSMISAGEKSGTLGKMFKDAAQVIDKKVDMALSAMMKLFEPTLIVVMGVVVAFIALGFYQMYVAALGSLF